MSRQHRHSWVRAQPGLPGAASARDLTELPPPLLPSVNAHRRLRGPYTAAGTIMRALVPEALCRLPDLVSAHAIEILSAAPELRDVINSKHPLLPSTSPDQDITRFFSRLRTLRLAHGLTEFLRDHVCAAGRAPVSLTLRHADEADQTDQEFIAVLLRRLDPGLITLVVGTASELAGSPADGPLAQALTRYAHAAGLPAPLSGNGRSPAAGTDTRQLAAAYVADDCLGADPAPRTAYENLPDWLRRRLHDGRAAELAMTGEYSWRLGAIPYHLERGSKPESGAAALREALGYCLDRGFYAAAIDLGGRGRAIAGWSDDPDTRYWLTTRLTTALVALGRPDEAEVLYDEVRRNTTDPGVHMSAAYSTAILLTRHYEEERRDHDRARGWLNEAIAIAALLPGSPRLALQKVFSKVGLALIENHLGNGEAALRLVSEGLELLPAGADPGEHRLPRSALHLRRVQTYAALGRMDAAVAEYGLVLEADPNYAEYHLELGNMLRVLGRDDEALAEYETAIGLSPPFAEAYYNRADLRAARGDLQGALADFRYVVELAPDNVDAHINLAGILVQSGDAQAASHAVDEGLAIAPGDAHLLCLRGQLDLAGGRLGQAKAALDAAIGSDPELAEAWATRGTLAFEARDLAGALADLSRAWEMSRDTTVLYNRAVVNQELSNWNEAIADFGEVLEQDPGEAESLLRRAACRAQAGDLAGSAADAHRFTVLAPGRAADAASLLNSR